MVDQRLRDGGMWYADEPQVDGDGYREDWGHQDATARFGPTADGVARGTNNPKPPGPSGQSSIGPRGRMPFPFEPTTGEKVRDTS